MTENSIDTSADPQSKSYQLTYDTAEGVLYGIVYEKPPAFVSPEHLKPQIKALECENLHFEADSLDQFLQKLKKGMQGRYALAEKRDATVQITLATDKMSARAKTTVAYGGAPLSVPTITEAIKQAKVCGRCVDKSKISLLVNSTKPLDIVIAEAIKPINGEDAIFSPLVESTRDIAKDINSEDAIDQHEIFEFVVVEPGHPLMRRIPATKGTDGIDVTGKAIKAKAGKEKTFTKPFEGVEVHPHDDTLLQAAIKGHPVICNDNVRVDPIMTVKAVDIISGNIHYDGSLYVQQDINSGYTIEVTGDIIVKGSIYQACLIAGGNIIAGGGIHAKITEDDSTCQLSAKGDIRAKFFHHCHVCSDGDIHAREYIMQSHVNAKGSILAGQEGGKGAIIGGHCQAGNIVHARVLGNDAYVPTHIIVGSREQKNPEVQQLRKKIKRRLDEQAQLNEALEKLSTPKLTDAPNKALSEKVSRIQETLALIEQQVNTLEDHLESLLANSPKNDHQVIIDNCAYLNVHLLIDGFIWKCTEIKRRFKISIFKHALKIDPIS